MSNLNTALIPTSVDRKNKLIVNLSSGQLLKVSASPSDALIICHTHHAEIVGNGAAVGGLLDIDCRQIVPIGNIALTFMESHQEKIQAYAKRQQWICATQKLIALAPVHRATQIIKSLESYCGREAIAPLSDEILAQLVGVLPKTMATARQFIALRSQKIKGKTLREASLTIK